MNNMSNNLSATNCHYLTVFFFYVFSCSHYSPIAFIFGILYSLFTISDKLIILPDEFVK